MDNITNLLPILNQTKTPTFSFADTTALSNSEH
jgi:hypothetical protein